MERLPAAQKKRTANGDQAAYFDVLGGPAHGAKWRIHAPFDHIILAGGHRYELNMTDDETVWTYIHTFKQKD